MPEFRSYCLRVGGPGGASLLHQVREVVGSNPAVRMPNGYAWSGPGSRVNPGLESKARPVAGVRHSSSRGARRSRLVAERRRLPSRRAALAAREAGCAFGSWAPRARAADQLAQALGHFLLLDFPNWLLEPLDTSRSSPRSCRAGSPAGEKPLPLKLLAERRRPATSHHARRAWTKCSTRWPAGPAEREAEVLELPQRERSAARSPETLSSGMPEGAVRLLHLVPYLITLLPMADLDLLRGYLLGRGRAPLGIRAGVDRRCWPSLPGGPGL